MSATLDIPAILKTFSPEQKESLLCALLRERCSESDAVIPLSESDGIAITHVNLDLLAQARDVTLDRSTEYLRELQRLVETREDSISFEEFMAESLPTADQ
jgi:hypothetical protein